MEALLLVLGVLAGALTTLAGMGGGIFMLLMLSLVMSPALALATTAPALLLGNLHRFWVMRGKVDQKVALAFALGAVPGSVAGGLALSILPEAVLRGLLVVTAFFAVLRAFGLFRRPVMLPSLAIVPAGFGIGAASATSGGAGLLVGPLLLSRGLSGEVYVATTALIAVSLHAGRIVAYGAGGLLSARTLAAAAILTVAIVCGNVLGQRVRPRMTDVLSSKLESGVLLVCVMLSLLGLR